MKKILKQTLSIVLVITMLLTTFCFFDVGTVMSKAGLAATDGTIPSITFYVPEMIYLTASTNQTTGFNTFKFYVDCDSSGNLRSGENTSGNVYFYCKDATSVSISCSGATVNSKSAGTAIFTGTTTVNSTITSGTLTSSISTKSYSTLTWTATYVLGGRTYTVKNYTVCYAPFTTPIANSASGLSDVKGTPQAGSTTWLIGANDIGSRDTGESADAYGGLSGAPTFYPGTSTPMNKNPNDSAPSGASNWFVWVDGGVGWSGYYWRDGGGDGEDHYGQYAAILYVDTSRYSNYNTIPALRGGVDFMSADHASSKTTVQAHEKSLGISTTKAETGNNTNIFSVSSPAYGSGTTTYQQNSRSSSDYYKINYSVTSSTLYLKGRALLTTKHSSVNGNRSVKALSTVIIKTTSYSKSTLRTA